MILSLYVARRFVTMFAIVLMVFIAVLFMTETIEQIRRVSPLGLGMTEAMSLAALNLPGSLYRILPLITILAAVALFMAMSRSSELVVIRAAGRSALRMLIAPVLTAVLIGAVAVAVLNPIVAGTAKRFDELSARYQLGSGNVLSVGSEGLWLRQGGTDGQTVIHAEASNPDGTQLRNVTFLSLAGQSRPVARYSAARARLEPGAWILSDVKEWPIATAGNPELASQRYAELTLVSDLTADRIRDSFGTPSTVPIWDLPAFIATLKRAGFSARQHQVWFQTELALPLLLGAMVLVGAGLTMRHARFGRTGLMALLSIVFGFAIFFVRNFAQVLGETGQIPVVLAAWSPPVAAVLLSLALVLHLEDG